ncbi:pectinesterase inhibitor 4-like [Phalaenopsis equestris]|uniref:pectinesterase inhibitor 4-like n=1 Tax=Phalaenopsis equestris TaxID=78828 RepID=UPI0009E48EA4|nr:pectinesterase inhibitor 4-like [Phalaenopsis equestris]
MAPSAPQFLRTASLNPIQRILLITLILLITHTNPSEAARPLPANVNKPASSTNTAELFVRSACSSTTYPDLCISSLTSYSSSINSNPMLLAHTALSVTLDGARSAAPPRHEVHVGRRRAYEPA